MSAAGDFFDLRAPLRANPLVLSLDWDKKIKSEILKLSKNIKNDVFWPAAGGKFWGPRSSFKKPPLVCPGSATRGVLKKIHRGPKIFRAFPLVLLQKPLLKHCFCYRKCIFGGAKSSNFPPAAGSGPHSCHWLVHKAVFATGNRSLSIQKIQKYTKYGTF